MKKWFFSYDQFTHFIGLVCGFYAISSQFRGYVAELLTLYQTHVPHIVQPLPVLFIAFLAYRNGRTSGKVEAGQGQKGAAHLPAMLMLLSLIALGHGCSTYERQTRDTIAVFRGYLAVAQERHTPECIAAAGKLPVCETLRKAASAENAAVTALEAYCQIPPHSTNNPTLRCSPVKSLRGAAETAIANVLEIMPEIKGAAQ